MVEVTRLYRTLRNFISTTIVRVQQSNVRKKWRCTHPLSFEPWRATSAAVVCLYATRSSKGGYGSKRPGVRQASGKAQDTKLCQVVYRVIRMQDVKQHIPVARGFERTT